jgi:TonB family protein
MAFFYKTKSDINPKVNCTECRKYKSTLDNGNMSVLEKYYAECFTTDSLFYKESSNEDTISYCKVWILLCEDITIMHSFFQMDTKTHLVKSFSTINDSTKLPIRLPINHFPKRSNLVPDSLLCINPGLVPTFPGGDIARINFIQQNLHYPEDAKAKGIQGIVRVSFIVDEKGNISDPKIFLGIGKSCDDECIRIVKLMPKWNPGIENGKPTKSTFNLPFRFTLQ